MPKVKLTKQQSNVVSRPLYEDEVLRTAVKWLFGAPLDSLYTQFHVYNYVNKHIPPKKSLKKLKIELWGDLPMLVCLAAMVNDGLRPPVDLSKP